MKKRVTACTAGPAALIGLTLTGSLAQTSLPPPFPPKIIEAVTEAIVKHYADCSHTALPWDELKQVTPAYRVSFNKDGSIAAMSPNIDRAQPISGPLSEKVIIAVRSCGPFAVPEGAAEFYPYWRNRVLRFGPKPPATPIK